MAATVWTPAPNSGRTATQTWLLQDGSTLTSPPLEMSGSGRRVRVVGEKNSFGITQVDANIIGILTVEAIATGTALWMKIDANDALAMRQTHGIYDDAPLTAAPNLDPNGKREDIKVFWEFQHPTLNITAYVVVSASIMWNRIDIATHLTYRTTHPGEGSQLWLLHRNRQDVIPVNWNALKLNTPERLAVETWVRKQVANAETEALPHLTWGDVSYTNGSRALLDFFIRVRQVNDLATVWIPDLRDPLNPQWLPLDVTRTSYTPEFDQGLTVAATTGPQVEKLKAATEEVIDTLRQLGMVVDNLPDKAYSAAMNGDLTHLAAVLEPDSGVDTHDPHHKVAINLATGTVAVVCMHDQTHKDQVGQAYQNAKFMAELKGDGDEFLAYAQEYVRRKAEEAAQNIIDERAALRKELDAQANKLGQSATGGTTPPRVPGGTPA